MTASRTCLEHGAVLLAGLGRRGGGLSLNMVWRSYATNLVPRKLPPAGGYLEHGAALLAGLGRAAAVGFP